MTRLLAAVTVLFLTGFAHGAEPCPDPARGTHIAGEIRRGMTFEAALGGGVAFRLVPVRHGWAIWVGDPGRPDDNYAAIATPPFHGINPLYVEGWHFRNSDNSGPNRAGAKNVNAPQETRDFRFVADRKSFLTARAALEAVLWPGASSVREIAAARRRWNDTASGCGRLKITAMTLGNLRVGEKAWIDRMAFTVDIGDGGG